MKPNVKTTLNTTGTMEINAASLNTIVMDWVKEETARKFNLPDKDQVTVKLQWPKDGEKRVTALLELSPIDEGAKPFGAPPKPPKKTTKYEGKRHKWEGLYSAIGEIIDEQRKRKKTFISYDDLLAELHEMEDGRGNKMFVKGGEELPMEIVRHRLAPSQIIRQAKNQPNLRGVENSKKDKGLKFS